MKMEDGGKGESADKLPFRPQSTPALSSPLSPPYHATITTNPMMLVDTEKVMISSVMGEMVVMIATVETRGKGRRGKW